MQKVNVVLYSAFPEILSNINGVISFDFEKCPTNHKTYTFYSCPECNGVLEAGDAVICQTNNTMTFGIVVEVISTCSREEFFRASIIRSKKIKNGYRLVLAKIRLIDLMEQLKFKHDYEANVRKLESAPPINELAFKMTLDNL